MGILVEMQFVLGICWQNNASNRNGDKSYIDYFNGQKFKKFVSEKGHANFWHYFEFNFISIKSPPCVEKIKYQTQNAGDRADNSYYKCDCAFVHSSHQLLGNVLVEDFLHGQGDDDFVAALEE